MKGVSHEPHYFPSPNCFRRPARADLRPRWGQLAIGRIAIVEHNVDVRQAVDVLAGLPRTHLLKDLDRAEMQVVCEGDVKDSVVEGDGRLARDWPIAGRRDRRRDAGI